MELYAYFFPLMFRHFFPVQQKLPGITDGRKVTVSNTQENQLR